MGKGKGASREVDASTQSDRRKKDLLAKKMETKINVVLEVMVKQNLTLEEAKVLLNLTTEHLNACQYRINKQLLNTPLNDVLRKG